MQGFRVAGDKRLAARQQRQSTGQAQTGKSTPYRQSRKPFCRQRQHGGKQGQADCQQGGLQ
ncbi:MAG: hypothetical protein DSZ01_00250 [Gammaproteobacteria bacterium]|nr:MAG: hypothetical protein DSZ01_00250 [Gammaproteobacteria bacterium]